MDWLRKLVEEIEAFVFGPEDYELLEKFEEVREGEHLLGVLSDNLVKLMLLIGRKRAELRRAEKVLRPLCDATVAALFGDAEPPEHEEQHRLVADLRREYDDMGKLFRLLIGREFPELVEHELRAIRAKGQVVWMDDPQPDGEEAAMMVVTFLTDRLPRQ